MTPPHPSGVGVGGANGTPPPPPAHQNQHVVYEFEFPSEHVGKLIGKGGRNLQQMMKETNTKMAVRTQTLRADYQVRTRGAGMNE